MATRRDLFEIEAQVPRGTLVYLSPDRIEPNPRQPRQQLSRAGLEELKASIAARGILQALLGVRGSGGRVSLIAGHRRWQAARELGLPRVPVVLIDNYTGRADSLIDAIIENVQRENLSPWEEGESYRQLATEFGWDHKQIAASIGKSRPYVTQRIRAAENLAPAVKEFFITGDERVLNSLENVTAVTPGEIRNNLEQDTQLAGFLNNVELVRRLSALTTAAQIEAVRQSLEQARRERRQLTLSDLTAILKFFRDQSPSPKARLKTKPATGSEKQPELDFNPGELEVVRWSTTSDTDESGRKWPPVELDRLIERYEKDLERLRRYKEQQNQA